MKQEYEVKRELKRLSSIKGAGTELISVYIPPGFLISDEIAKLRDEHGQASNIKSKTTRLNVQGALEKIMQYLKLYKTPPKNGLAIFCGNISKEQAKPDIELFSMEPPQPIKANIYRCDSSFLLEPIERMMEAKDIYGIVLLDGREATVAMLKGTQFVVEKKLRSFAHQKVHKGGQSAARYDRAREESIDDYYKVVGDTINDMFAKYEFKPKGLIVGGPGPTKDNFVRAKVLNYQIKVLGVFDTGYTDENEGARELLEHAKDLLSEQAVTQERNVMEKFMSEVARNGLAVSGYEKVKAALMSNNVSKLIISDDAELYEVSYKCSNCGAELSEIERGNERKTHHDCGGSLAIVSDKDAIELLIELADKNGVDVVFVSSDSQYGKQLLLGFGGVAAMLKYRG
ncbi:MAG: peptide chain release factor aRF-1 [Candidatus Marsarchaeota archaeon]|nr:peptide chain release factor aRF-1 [Candidatus Marsarchaeota archaeon]